MKKFTKLEDELIKEINQASQTFNTLYTDALKKIDIIKIGLDDMAIEQTKNSRNWAYVGNMDHINQELDNILEFLNLKDTLSDSKKYNI